MTASISPAPEAAPARVTGFWRGWRLWGKLAFGSSVLLGLAALLAALGLAGMLTVQSTYDDLLQDSVAAQRAGQQINTELLAARQNEADFNQRWQTEGFDAAYNAYVTENQRHVALARQLIADLARQLSLETQPEAQDAAVAQELVLISPQLTLYAQAFQQKVELVQQREFADTGLEGQFRLTSTSIEARVEAQPELNSLLVIMLQLGRYEKDFLLSGEQRYVDLVHAAVDRMKAEAAASSALSQFDRQEIIALMDDYQTAFDRLVTIEQQIAEQTSRIDAAAGEIQSRSSRIVTASGEELQAAIGAAEDTIRQTLVAVVLSVVVLLGLGLGVSYLISRQISQPIGRLTRVAGEMAAGHLNVTAPVETGDEVGDLAVTFNQMTERLRALVDELEERARALSTSADVSRRLSTILDASQLASSVVAQVQSVFHYYHAHIYLYDEAREHLVMVGGTGEAGAVMLARGHRLARGRGLVGRAASTNAPVFVPDTSRDPAWLPNPLLPETRAEIAVPISIGDDVLGVLDVQHNVVGQLRQTDVDLLQSIANQTAVALQNARTYAQAQRRAEREALANLIAQRIQATASVEGALQVAARELGQALRAARASAELELKQAGNSQDH